MELKVTQQNLLDLMITLDGICRKENISYSLHGGTLLGAVREKGFIPWDDDMDILMTRGEFEKLEEALSNHPQYHIAGNIKKQFRQKGENRYWVDIFICDYISHRPLQQKLKQLTLTLLDVMNRDKHTISLSDFSKHDLGKRLAFKAAYWCGKLLTKQCKGNLYKKVSRDLWLGNRTLYMRSNDQYSGRVMVSPVHWLDTYYYVPFAHTELAISSHYHDILTAIYGDDYMTPRRDDRNNAVHDLLREDADFNL